MPEDFVTADTHFGHAGILRHAGRPWSTIEEHDAAVIERWNTVVNRRDRVFILGDFAWKDHARYIMLLHGRKHLIKGSHDRMPLEVLRNFTEVYDGGRLINIGGRPYWCAHQCHRVWERGHFGVPHLFGHSHGRLVTFNLSADVGVDCSDRFVGIERYTPLPEWSVKEFMDSRASGMELEERTEVMPDGRKIWKQDDVRWLLNRGDASAIVGELAQRKEHGDDC